MICSNDNPQDHDDAAAFDELLGEAAWPEPDPNSVSRLVANWRSLSAARRRKASFWWGAAVAASLLLAVVTWRMRPQNDDALEGNQPMADIPRSNGHVGSQQPSTDNAGKQIAENQPSPTVVAVVKWPSREPTAFERLAFHMMQAERRPVDEKRPVTGELDDRLTEALDRLVSDPSIDRRTLVAPLLSNRVVIERRLVELARRGTDPRRTAAIELLGELGGQRAVAVLLQLSRDEQVHIWAVLALAKCADSLTIRKLAFGETDAGARRELFGALLERGDVESVGYFLGFALNPKTSETALASIDDLDKLPTSVLFRYFDSPHLRERMAAARVLGTLNDPDVSRRMIESVNRNVKRSEALVALLSSSEREAETFLKEAQQNSPLMAAVQTARIQYQNAMQ